MRIGFDVRHVALTSCTAAVLAATQACSPVRVAPVPSAHDTTIRDVIRYDPPPPLRTARDTVRWLVDSLISQPKFRSAEFGVLIVDPERSDTIYSHNAGKLFIPASNMKIVTSAVALKELGPDFRWKTTFAARGTRSSRPPSRILAAI